MANLPQAFLDPRARRDTSGFQALGQILFNQAQQKKQREAQLQDAITLAREKAKITQESGGGFNNLKNVGTLLSTMKVAQELGIPFSSLMQTGNSSTGVGVQPSTIPQQPSSQPISTPIPSSQPIVNPLQSGGRQDLVAKDFKPQFNVLTGKEELKPTKFVSPKAIEAEQFSKELSKKKSQVEVGKLVSLNNFSNIAKSMKGLADVYVDAVEEGGAGGLFQELFTKTGEFLGDVNTPFGSFKIGSETPKAQAFEGKRVEALSKMMPMLTQQATKPEGSVRLVESIFRALGRTIPSLKTATAPAKEQLKQSLLSFYNFAKSAEELDQSFDSVFQDRELEDISDNELDQWAQSVATIASNVNIEGTELEELNKVIDTVLEPFNRLDGQQQGGGVPSIGQTFNGQKVINVRRIE